MDDLTGACRHPGADRRRTNRFVLIERRSGFERRRSQGRAPMAATFDGPLAYLRDHPVLLAETLMLVNILSLLDLIVTRAVLRLGATELNPVMAYLLHLGPAQAAVTKALAVGLATLGIWTLRRRRTALAAALFLLGLYSAVVLYDLAGLAVLR